MFIMSNLRCGMCVRSGAWLVMMTKLEMNSARTNSGIRRAKGNLILDGVLRVENILNELRADFVSITFDQHFTITYAS